MPTRSRLEARASLVALAIATTGASLHMVASLAWDAYDDDLRVRPVHCVGGSEQAPATAPRGAVADASYLEAVELHCRAAGALRCDIDQAIAHTHALQSAVAAVQGSPAHVFLRFAPAHERIVWTILFDDPTGATVDVDAFDAHVVEFSIDGVTTN